MKLKQKGERVVDIHCHILPGLDDGAQSMEETVAMLHVAAAEGITDVIATPHFKHGGSHFDPEKVMQRIETVQSAIDEEQIPITLYPGCEIFYFGGVEELLRDKRAMTLNHSRYVLIEFSPAVQYSYLRNALHTTMDAGYLPILAHAERYDCLRDDLEDIEYLNNSGVHIQINADSVISGGIKTKKFVQQLLKHELVDFIATDAHDNKYRQQKLAKCRSHLIRKYGSDYADLLMRENALKILV